MPANTSPIFILTPKAGFVALTTGSNNYDGTSGSATLFTAGTNGSFLNEITLEAAGTNIATVIRFWINNGSSIGTATNNSLFCTWGLAATTASATSSTQPISIPIRKLIPAGYLVVATLATTVAAGWATTAWYGDY